ncbi:hypothetical protein AB0B12_40625 [Streptomyces sp. NPDC044780]|uniref:hypothetical protein n=1 Tax=unclassified Streptomyces TaxID=2593676 RepID=UPI0033EE3A83
MTAVAREGFGSCLPRRHPLPRLGARTLGTDREHGPLIGDDDTDDDIVRHARNVADRLTQQAAKIRTSLAAAHMVTPFERAS